MKKIIVLVLVLSIAFSFAAKADENYELIECDPENPQCPQGHSCQLYEGEYACGEVTELFCQDTDGSQNGGVNPELPGGVFSSFFDVFFDICTDSTHIQEGFCDGVNLGTETIECSGSCMSVDGPDFCVPSNDIPEFGIFGASFALAGAGAYLYRRRK